MSDPAERVTHTLDCVLGGLLHDLANVATAVEGIAQTLQFDGPTVAASVEGDLARTSERLFEVHRLLRSLVPDHAREEAIDPRPVAAEAARLLAWHSGRRCDVTLEEGPVAPVLGTAWRLRRQLLAALDAAAGGAKVLRFALRVDGDAVVAVTSAGEVIWSAPTLAASRRAD